MSSTPPPPAEYHALDASPSETSIVDGTGRRRRRSSTERKRRRSSTASQSVTQAQALQLQASSVFRPFPVDADSMTSHVWWAHPCSGLLLAADQAGVAETARDVRRATIQQTTVLIDGHVAPLLEDFKNQLSPEFDLAVGYSFFPVLPSDQTETHFQNLSMADFHRNALELLECYAMLTEQVLCDQQNHRPRATAPRLLLLQQRTRDLLCSCAKTMAFESVPPKRTIYRGLVPNAFRFDVAFDECNRKCYCLLRDYLAALRYILKGFVYWDRQLGSTPRPDDQGGSGIVAVGAVTGQRQQQQQRGKKKTSPPPISHFERSRL